ncbi:hypothetical protein T265_08000 [Opisthorchis viverrini]|uniref:Uncharacterized protein n=1 Tax=Opisthorchis viverrini TaxID=6198 RepID=A0A075A9U7_OPIVI|nr:hypothetical protein T265_08000 [Opisthorchis viverrini]KER24314.1 hypothetical protein T265_08000 [Opisthorchis viverrini]
MFRRVRALCTEEIDRMAAQIEIANKLQEIGYPAIVCGENGAHFEVTDHEHWRREPWRNNQRQSASRHEVSVQKCLAEQVADEGKRPRVIGADQFGGDKCEDLEWKSIRRRHNAVIEVFGKERKHRKVIDVNILLPVCQSLQVRLYCTYLRAPTPMENRPTGYRTRIIQAAGKSATRVSPLSDGPC